MNSSEFFTALVSLCNVGVREYEVVRITEGSVSKRDEGESRKASIRLSWFQMPLFGYN
jgi:hypothetical protein